MFRHCYGLLAAALVIAAGWASPALAQRDDFLGVLALAVEDEVGPRIDLTETQKKTLLGLIEQRENAALELAMSLKDAPPEERTKQLDAFRRESEAKALAALSPQQRSRLEGIRVRRRGMEAATEADVAKRLNLTPEQQTKIGELARERTERLAKADAKSAQVIRAESERADGRRLERCAAVGIGGRGRGRGQGRHRRRPRPALPPASGGSPRRPRHRRPPRRPPSPRRAPAEKTPEQPVAGQPPAAPTSAAPPAESPVAKSEAAPAEPVKLPDKLRFSFRFQPWKDVLDWFAQQAGLSLVMDAPPQGHVQLHRRSRVHARRGDRPAEQRLVDQGLHARAPRTDADAGQPRGRHPAEPGRDDHARRISTVAASSSWCGRCFRSKS